MNFYFAIETECEVANTLDIFFSLKVLNLYAILATWPQTPAHEFMFFDILIN
jgi:hypothetical protein